MECLREKFVGGVVLDGRYQAISPLNHGSFGMVFTAQDLETNQTVAIKCLTKRSASAEAGLELAIDDKSEEFALHTRIGSHPNIVNLLNTFETDAHVYLVLEYCSQGDLYEAIRNGHGPLETEHVRQFMLQLVDAVALIHSKGVYHRDIKPENIFLTQDGTMKLGDFGLATTDKWSYEMTVGSDRYMAPEQFDSAGAGYSPAEADIWAIGICLLNILFSRNPFTTPTEADPLFLDFSRDKQSLFDVFPSMSQDTYEVIVQCMNLDPRKRSLEGARDALLRVVSFTTQDEALDDFCTAEKATVASANREPLRTPSIQSPHIDDSGAFPWTKALHATPRHGLRQLSVIPDDESYTEDLFPKSEETTGWISAAAQTPSMSSMVDSSLGASMKSLAIHQEPRPSKVSPTTGSLPIRMAKPLNLSMSTVFGRRQETVSKSWSDMWEEDEEEEREQQRMTLQELNSRTWSHESKTEVKESHGIKGDVDDDLVADGFFFHEPASAKKPQVDAPRYSPPSKRSNFDKWAALGERRRGQNLVRDDDYSPNHKPARRHFGFGFKSYEAGVLDHYNYQHKSPHQQQQWGKERVKACPWNKGRDWNWRRDRRADLGDVEWVGAW
ncbi:Serine/threonine-protein kinase-like protein [Hapsidospora chrysogenum ATCC 11550]|uniref:non-specific serine/threonine protein kinase n=1 Tax=Hapsidospora chrysogenum (strain ATCC 11550 / CBS 779.69 / DSM 880 / IAM 14645 / JCM 23072 / IMI 49137) TaxID=857340 RepID=A0A086T181_HAPC1|nr:Serine/threonine-protein kinase-like protein [Hapsidospora chrysogenum ATCC 11550]